MRRRRVALLINNLARGGAETQCVRLALSLHERGYRVRVLTLLPSTAHTETLADVGVPVVHVAPGSDGLSPAMATGLYRELRSFRPDVLISFLFQSNLAGRVIGRIAGVPVIITSIRNEYFGGSDRPSDHPLVRLREQLIRWTDPLAAVTTTNSEYVRVSLNRRGISPRDVRVIPNMVPDDYFSPRGPETRERLRRDLRVDPDRFVWINVARLFRQKDHDSLLRAYSRLESASELWIVGGGELEDRLRALAGELGLDDRVRFLGERADVPDLLTSADAFVLSSQWEGLPNVLLEAGASGLPLVSTDVGGVREILPPDQHDLLLHAGDQAALTERLARIEALPESDRCPLGQQLRAHIQQRFGQNQVLDRWINLMEEQVRQTTDKNRR